MLQPLQLFLLSAAGTHHLRKEARWGGIYGARHALPASECQGAAGPAGGGWTTDMGSDVAPLHGSHRWWSQSVSESCYLQSRWNLDSQGDIECVTSSHKALYKVGMINLSSTQMLIRGSGCHLTLSRAQDLVGKPSPQAPPHCFHCIVSSLSQ